MPYCPKCDMEFIDGITVCSDCGGPLVESKEVTLAMKKEEEEREKARRFAAMKEAGYTPEMFSPEEAKKRAASPRVSSSVYVNKAQKYQDMKSSAAAFYAVGGVLTAVSALLWSGLISLPLTGISRLLTFGVLTVMGIVFLFVAFSTSKSARALSVQVQDEAQKTADIKSSFLNRYTAASIDKQLGSELNGLSPEEISLKRLELIQDILITSNDISDQTYADALADELYGIIFEE